MSKRKNVKDEGDRNDTSVQVIDIKQFSKLFPVENFVSLGNDFMLSDIHYDSAFDQLSFPCKFDGFMAVCCLEGEIDLDLNLSSYHMEKSSLMVSVPSQILRISHQYEDSRSIHCILVAVSKEFLSSISFDFGKLFSDGIKLLDNPVVKLRRKEEDILSSYLNMAYQIMNSDIVEKQAVIGPLVSSAYNVIADVWNKNMKSSQGQSSSIRSRALLGQFLTLLSENYNDHRDLSFYAAQLGMTPKYLSRVIKNQTGRSAAQWIDSYVILEAKNLLKHSDLNIKEIVEKMKFQNQSVFYKFFKTHTGKTPTQYRNS